MRLVASFKGILGRVSPRAWRAVGKAAVVLAAVAFFYYAMGGQAYVVSILSHVLPRKVAISYLTWHLSVTHPLTRAVTISELASRGGDAARALTQSLSAGSPEERATAAKALGLMAVRQKPQLSPADDAQLRQRLVAAIDDEDSLVRVCAARALWQWYSDRDSVLPVLVAAAGDESQEVAYLAIDMLGSMGPEAKEALQALVALERTAHPNVRPRLLDAIEEVRGR